MEIKVGCCGYPVAKGKYYSSLSLVEINATFYKYLDSRLLEKWRREAPQNFEFTVKAHQDISHNYKLAWRKETEQAFNRMVETCETLKAEILLIQTPGSLRPSKETFETAREFFRKTSGKGLTLVWETRGPDWFKPENLEALGRLLSEVNVIHCVDPFLGDPAYTTEIAYFRLHGLGEKLYYYEHSNAELKKLKTKISSLKGVKKAYVLFNNLAMFTDAVRFKTYLETGKFPPLMDAYGVEAAWQLFKGLKFPVSLKNLMAKIGWRLIEVKPGRQISLKTLLSKLPEKTYKKPEELLEAVKKAIEEV